MERLDNVNKTILKELEKNSRTTISVLSAKVGLSMPAVSERVRKLESDGYIESFTMIPGKVITSNYPVTMQTMIKLKRANNYKAFQDFIKEHDHIRWYSSIAGHFDFAVHIVAKDTEELGDIIQTISGHPDVAEVETTLFLKEQHKSIMNLLIN